MKTDTVLNAFDFNTPVETCTKAEYDLLQQEGKLREGEIYCIVDDNSIGIASSSYPQFVATGTDGTYYSQFEFNENGVQIEDLENIKTIEKALFEAFKRQVPERAEEWDTLLKINQGDYEITVRQIMEAYKE